MRIWALKSCDTCRKAVKNLSTIYPDLKVTDVRVDGVEPEDLQRFFTNFGDDLVNARSTTWRGLTEEERKIDPLTLLAQHPTLMKRPVIEADGTLYLGWGKDVQNAFNLG